MRSSSELLLLLVGVSGLVVAGGITFGLMASANSLAASCASSGTPISCSITDADQGTTINTPSAVQALVTLDTSDNAATADQYILVTYSLYCTEGSNSGTTTNPTTNPPTAIALGTPVTVNLTLPSTTPTPDSCIVQSLTATLEAGASAAAATTSTTGSFSMDLTYTPGSGSSSSSSTSPTTTHVSTVSGYGGKCVDDQREQVPRRQRLRSSSGGATAQTRRRGGRSPAVSSSTTTIAANIQGNGGSSGSKLILWSCTGASVEVVPLEQRRPSTSHRGTACELLCVDDPGYSKSNGTQLIVYKCHNSGNQHWSS